MLSATLILIFKPISSLSSSPSSSFLPAANTRSWNGQFVLLLCLHRKGLIFVLFDILPYYPHFVSHNFRTANTPSWNGQLVLLLCLHRKSLIFILSYLLPYYPHLISHTFRTASTHSWNGQFVLLLCLHRRVESLFYLTFYLTSPTLFPAPFIYTENV